MWKRQLLMAGVLGMASCGQVPESQDRYTIVIVEKEAAANSSETSTSADREVVESAFEGVNGGESGSSEPDTGNTETETPDQQPDGETTDPINPTEETSEDGEWSVVPRDLETECLVLGDHFHACGIFSDSVYAQYVEICTSSTVSPGMKAGTIACTLQLTCGDDNLPQCFHDGIEPECADDLDCGDGVCINEVCHELVWTTGGGAEAGGGPDDPVQEACLQVGYGTGTPDVTSEVVVGSACGHGSHCASGRCVWAESDEDPTLDRSWCANKGDCRFPDNADHECPSGFTCTEVLTYVVEDNPRWLCVPDEIEACEPLF